MTEIERKALALVNEVLAERNLPLYDKEDIAANTYVAAVVCRAIEQHEAFRQEVSDAVEALLADTVWSDTERRMIAPYVSRFISKPPVDPLVEALKELDWCAPEKASDLLRQALAARGLKIVEVE